MKRRQKHWYKINAHVDELVRRGFQVKDCGDHFKVLMTPAEMVSFAYEAAGEEARVAERAAGWPRT